MQEEVSRLPDGDYEQSMMFQLFLDCVDRATASSTAFVSFREHPMHFQDNQTLNFRVVDPVADEGVGAIIDGGCNSCCHGEVSRQNAEAKVKVLALHPMWLHRKATTFNGVGTSTTSGKLRIPMAIRLQESDMVIPGCVHSHEIPEKTHPLLVSQACQAKLGMTKRVHAGSITLDDYDAQSLAVARQVGTSPFVIRIDHLIYNDYVCNPLLNDLVIDFDDEPGVDSPARDSDQSKFFGCATHAIVNVRCCEIPRSVLQADTIVVSCGLANFAQSSWSAHRRHEFWGTHEELDTKEDYDKFVRNFTDNYPEMCDGRSIWTIDCTKFDDPDNDRSLRKHIGQNPRIRKSILESENYHALHSRLYDGMHWFFSSRNIVIMICRSGRQRSVANAELWSNTLNRCSRHQHSVSLLPLSELD